MLPRRMGGFDGESIAALNYKVNSAANFKSKMFL